MDDAGTGRRDNTLRLTHHFAAAPEKVFAAWTEADALKRWWCPPGWLAEQISIDPRVGGSYRFGMRRESGSQCVAIYGMFLEVVPARRLVYTWNWHGAFSGMPDTRVTVDFLPNPIGTELRLTQEPLDLRICTLHVSGWLVACTRLADVLKRAES